MNSPLDYLCLVCFVYWAAAAIPKIFSLIEIYRFHSDSDPGFRSYTLYQLSFTVGAFGLSVFSALCLFLAPELVEHYPLLPILVLILLILLILSERFFALAVEDKSGFSTLLMMNQLFAYMWVSRRQKLCALRVSSKIPRENIESGHVKARTILPTVNYLIRHFGRDRTKEILKDLEMPLDYLLYPESEVSISFAKKLFDRLKQESGRSEEVIFEAQSCGANIECLGLTFFMLARFLSIKKIYQAVVRMGNQFDQNFYNEILDISDNQLTMRCHLRRDEVRVFGSTLVHSVGGWISSLPNIKGLPHAKVETLIDPHLNPEFSYAEFRLTWVNSLYDGVSLVNSRQ